ncbi:MAG TPA: Gp37 family protein, partial [Leptolyngbyaceae cyanobacterium]
EKRIADLLAPLRSRNILARALPSESGEVGFPVTGNGVVQVAIDSAVRADHASLDMKIQKRLYSVICDIRLKHRHGESGLFQVANEIEQLLHGAQVENFGPLEFKSYRELGRTESYWVAEMALTCLRLDRKQ